jgi:predicted ATPase/DNA-binding CsgD family transcriptional regulator
VSTTELALPPTSLPRPLTRFIGRQDEIDTLMSLLEREDVRLVTLTGPGGIGKTRLAIEVARSMARNPAIDVRFVSLAAIENGQDAVLRICGALGLWNCQYGDAVPRVIELLKDDRVLLFVDNLEHVIDIASDIASLLSRTSRIQILATSRIPLHIQGEREYSVPQLSTISEDPENTPASSAPVSEAVELFVDRVRSIDNSFSLDMENLPIISAICDQLEGLPLAIELAAARTRVLPPSVLLARLENQLDLLRTSGRDVPARLRTIRATIDWSYQLLREDEQQALRRLSVFQGNISLSGAAVVLHTTDDETLDVLQALIDHSLLRSRDPVGDEPSFLMLTVVRQFGLEKLNESGELVQTRLDQAEWAAKFCESLFHEQLAANQHNVFWRIRYVHDSIRQAVLWAMENGHWILAARIAGNLWQYWDISGHLQQGRSWLRQIIQQDVEWPQQLVPRLFYGFAILAGSDADAHENKEVGNWLLQKYGHLDDIRIRATAANALALCRESQLAFDSAVEAMHLWEQAGEAVWHGLAAGLAGRWARELGDLDASERYSRRSWDVLSEAGHHWGASLARQGIARVHHLRGDIDTAEVEYRKGLQELASLGDRILVLRYFEFLLEIAAQRAQWERTARLAGAASRQRTLMGYQLRYQQEAEASRQLHDKALEALGPERFEEAFSSGASLTLDDSVALALDREERDQKRLADSNDLDTPLTRREIQVLGLIVAGKTDQEIADELFVSYRTVTTHVTHILNKLDADTRTEAATIALRTGLIV